MKQKGRLTPLQKVLDGASILICLGNLIYIAVKYQCLPEQIASNYDAAGNITGYQAKSMLFLLAFFMVFLVTIPMSVLVRIRKLYKAINSPWPIPKGQEERIVELTKVFLCVTNLTITVLFAYLTQCCIHSWKPVLFWLPLAVLGVALVVLFVKMRDICKNPRDRDPWETWR